MDILTLENGRWSVGLVPDNGGCVAWGRVNIDGDWVDVLRPTPTDRLGEWWFAASYPLIPWSNRIRHGELLWKGKAYQLRRWGTEDFAMHGTAVEFPWTVVERGTDHALLEFDSREFYGVNFPWSFLTRALFSLDGSRFTVRLSIENVDRVPFPAGMGHHPYFVRSISPTDESAGEEARLQVNCERGYVLENCMPSAPAGPLPPPIDFRGMRSLGSDLIDDCLTDRTSPIAATIEYPGTLSIDLEAGDLLTHVVVYVPVGEPYFAVEPVTNANDAFTLDALGVPGVGVFSVEPGETKTTEFTLVAR